MENNNRSGTQGISGKYVKVGKMLSDHGTQIVTGKKKAEVDFMDNRGYKPRPLPLSSIKINEINIIKVGLDWIDSIIDFIKSLIKISQKP